MEGSDEITNLVDILASSQLWQAIVVFIIGFVVLNILKTIASTIFQYILFTSDIYGIGSYVEYKGKRGIIKHRGLRRISIELETESATMYISTMDHKNLILIMPDEIKTHKKD